MDTLSVNSCGVTQVPFAAGLPQKQIVTPDIVQHPEIKYVKDVSCVGHLSFVQNGPIVTIDLLLGARLHQLWKKMGRPGGQSQCHNSPQGRLHSSLQDSAKSDKITHHHKLPCKSSEEQLLMTKM